MLAVASGIMGGVGLFLLGMILMTDGLKGLAGDGLRRILEKFTGNRFSAAATGAAVTALVQSSSATTLATIGFVSAGLLSFGNAIGVVIGANLGTTSTGWLVALLGLKLSLGKVMLPLVGAGALAKLLSKGRLAQAGTALAGFGVIFVGIDVLQAGMKDLSAFFRPEDLPMHGLGGRVALVGAGVLMSVLMQSSSAAVATTLAALSGGAIGVEQAAALVVGQNVGTTVTAILAAMGASTAAKRTATVHVLFNLVTGAVAFLLLRQIVQVVEALSEGLWENDPALTIAAFHTSFNLLGTAMFLPFTGLLSKAAERLIRQRGSRLTAMLDHNLSQVPSLATEAARRAMKMMSAELFALVSRRFVDTQGPPQATVDEIDEGLDEVRRFLASLPPPERRGAEFARQVSILHAVEHMEQLVKDARRLELVATVRSSAPLSADARELSTLLSRLAAQIPAASSEFDIGEVRAFSERLAEGRRAARPAILEATAERRMDPEEALRALSAQRWLDRIGYHAWRIAHHLREMDSADVQSSIPGALPGNTEQGGVGPV